MSKTDLIVEFTGKLSTHDDGITYVRVPVLTSSHVVQGDRAQYTDTSLKHDGQALGLAGQTVPVDCPLLTRVRGGKFMGTFQMNLRTRQLRREATEHVARVRREFYAVEFEDRTEGLIQNHERALREAWDMLRTAATD